MKLSAAPVHFAHPPIDCRRRRTLIRPRSTLPASCRGGRRPVEGLSARIQELERVGIRAEHVEGVPQDEHGIATFPDGTRLAWLRDPDDNWLSMAEFPR